MLCSLGVFMLKKCIWLYVYAIRIIYDVAMS